MKEKKLYLGLDIGTNSIGWAVTDENYNLVRRKGQDLWGVRKFESASNADARRSVRSSRRNLQRRKQRIVFLNEIFKPELDKLDNEFLSRLKESQLYIEDKTVLQKNTLFNDKNFNDKDFHKKYPTISHLIVDLIENGTNDIRLLYLAVHKLLKSRGHFLFEGLNFDLSNIDNSNYEEILAKELNSNISNVFGDDYLFYFNQSQNDFFEILVSKDGKRDKQAKFKKLFDINTKDSVGKIKQSILDAIIGSASSKLHILFENEELKEDSNNDIKLDREDFDDYLNQVLPIIELEGVELLKSLKKIYDWVILKGVLKGEKLISYAMKSVYEEHKKDLKRFKEYVRKHHKYEYNLMFKTKNVSENKGVNVANYANYVANSKTNSKKNRTENKSKEEFYSFVKKFIANADTPDKDWIVEKIEKGNFLPKQISKLNASIPNQLRVAELKLILDKNIGNFKFLKHIDESGVSNYDKLIKICEFRIPYFVGPLNNAHKIEDGYFSWIKKKEGKTFEKITPWNFDDMVDLDATNKAFFDNLINNCTYLYDEKVLPKHSLLNSKHIILNTINKIKVNFQPIRLEDKKNLFYHLINVRKITRKVIENYFLNSGLIKKGEEKNIEGIDIDLNIPYPAYAKIKDILKEKIDYDKDFDLLESIILEITMASNAVSAKSALIEKYENLFSTNEINSLATIKLKDWARLSKQFLKGIKAVDKETGEVMTLVDALFETNYNLNELLYNDFEFMKAVDNFNQERQSNVNEKPTLYNKVQNTYASNPVKRQIWQSLLVVKELNEILEVCPNKVFIEMARGGEDQKKRTSSRKKQLEKLYKTIKDDKRNWLKEIDETEDTSLKSERLFLYYMQMGKCAYSGKSINLSDLYNANLYDVDHIYPQSKIKDDSLHSNKVLVLKDENQKKLDKYPISVEVRGKMEAIWKYWLDKDLISKEKYKRLTRHVELSQDECADFINRQLVETRQTTKLVAGFINDIMPETKIVYSKVRNVADFKDFARDDKNPQKTNLFIKVREINDLHHAKDAYLNIVVGNVYNTKFGFNAKDYFAKFNRGSYNLKNLFKYTTKNAWYVEDEKNTFEIVKANYAKNTPIVTNMNFIKDGGFYDQLLKRKGKGLQSIKASGKFLKGKLTDTSKYGGYGGISNSYLSLIRITQENKVVKRLEFVPVIVSTKINQGKLTLEEYFKSQFQAAEIKILLPKIKIKSLFKVDGSFVLFAGKTGESIKWISANQPIFDEDANFYIRKIINYKKKTVESRVKQLIINEKYDLITKEENLNLYDKFTSKFNTNVFKNLKMPNYYERLLIRRDKFISLSVEEQSLLLYEILMVLAPNATLGDLKLIEESGFAGMVRSTQNIDLYNEIKLINTSITGVKKHIIDLKKLD